MIRSDDDITGPQAARNRRLWASEKEEKKVAVENRKDEAHTHDLPHSSDSPYLPASFQQQQDELLRSQIISLTDEKKFYSKYIARILDQLRHLLQKYGELDKLNVLTSDPVASVENNDTGSKNVDSEIITPWSIAKECLNPLLVAYDLRIAELQETIEESKKSIDAIAARSDVLTKENNTLRKELEASTERLVERARQKQMEEPVNITGEMFGSNGFDSLETSEYLAEMNERLQILIAENSTLMQQISLQDEELSTLHQDVKDKDDQIMTMGSNFNDATVALQELKASCDMIRKEKQHCESQFQHYAIRIAQLENEKDAISEQRNDQINEIKSLKEQIKSLESDIHAMKVIGEEKEEHFIAKYQTVCTRLRDLTNVSDSKEKMIDNLQDRNRSMKLEFDSMRQDCEGMLRVMNSMEKQLNQYASREDAVAGLEADTKSKVANMLLEKEKAENREASARRETTRLLESIQFQATQHAKERDEMLQSRAKKYEADLKQRDLENNELSCEIGHLRGKLDSIASSHKETERKLASSLSRTKELTIEFENRLKSIGKRMSDAEEARDAAQIREEDHLRQLHSTQEELSKAQVDFREHVSSLNEKISRVEKELECRRSELRESKIACDERDEKIKLLNAQLIKVKSDCASRFTAELESVTIQNQKLKASLMELELQLLNSQRDTQSAIDASLREQTKLEHRFAAEIETLRMRIAALKEEKRRNEIQRNDAEAKCSRIGVQLQELGQKFDDLRELYAEKEEVCDEMERRMTDLGSQLTLALSKQQHAYRQERELRSNMERLMMEKSRMERELKKCHNKLMDQQRKVGNNEPYHMFASMGHKKAK